MPEPAFLPSRVVSGGQTGVDRAGLDWAISLGIQHGGWCPRGRLAEDGTIPSRYELVELASPDYAVRTEQNVIDSDATLILYEKKLRGGTLLTFNLCKRLGKPYVSVRMDDSEPRACRDWLDKLRPETLNIAGSRESISPGIYDRALHFLLAMV